RKQKSQIVNEDGNSWAVSYSDMLMVLMSFFVIFFSFEGEQREKIISRIAVDINDQTNKGTGGSGGSNSGGKAAVSQETGQVKVAKKAHSGLAEIAEILRGTATVTVGPSDLNELTVQLGDQIYGKGEFNVSGKLRRDLDKVLSVLLPYRDFIH